MSERGSFVTEYISCTKCFQEAKRVLVSRNKFMCSVTIPTWDQDAVNQELPIIAGKIGGIGAGDELITFDLDVTEQLANVLCHSMRIAVLAEHGEKIFTVTPNHL